MSAVKAKRAMIAAALALVFPGLMTLGGVAAPENFRTDPWIGEGMVFQRGVPFEVSGDGNPGDTVTVVLDKATSKTRVDSRGRWTARLPAFAEGGPYTLRICASSGARQELPDIYAGDVWICSGQSNMQMPVWGLDPFFRLSDGNKVAASAHDPQLRLFQVPHSTALHPQTRFAAEVGWKGAVSPEAVKPFSAVGYSFGRELRRRHPGVPIGLVGTYWGGTRIEPWIPERALASAGYTNEIARLVGMRRIDFKPQMSAADAEKYNAWLKAFERAFEVESRPGAWRRSDCESIPSLNAPGVAEYRFTFKIGPEAVGHDFVFHIDAVDDADITFLDGREIGATTPLRGDTSTWEKKRDYAFKVDRPGRHEIVVRGYSFFGSLGLSSPVEVLDRTTGVKTDLDESPFEERILFRADIKRLGARPMPPEATSDPRKDNTLPSSVFNAMVAPLKGMRVTGTIWFQGCANGNEAGRYAGFGRTLVGAWREWFEYPSMPFLVAQLGSFKRETPRSRLSDDFWKAMKPDDSGFAFLREAQYDYGTDPGCGIACAIDIGDHSNIHFPNKREVGRRLAHEAFRVAYGEKGFAPGPSVVCAFIRNGKVVVKVKDAGEGLSADGDGVISPRVFSLAGEDGTPRWATARIADSDEIEVESEAVAEPREVRYAFTGYAGGNLIRRKGDGLPLFPFRAKVSKPQLATTARTSATDRYAAWCAWREAYEPDYSDSSGLLEPPETGRIARPIRIAEGGRARAEIVIDDSKAVFIDNFFPTNVWNVELRLARGHERAVARFAARELAGNLKRITGADFPVVRKSEGKLPVRMFLGPTFAKAHFADDLAALSSGGSSDGFAVRVKDGDIYIFGARPAGTLYGVHAFIENNTDLIWAFPLPRNPDDDFEGTVFTERKTLDIVWADAREKPAFIERGWQGGDETWMYRNRCNYDCRDPDRGFFFRHGGHYLSPQYYDFSAGIREYNPVDGKGVRAVSWSETSRITCLTGKDLVRHAAESVPCVKTMRYDLDVSCVFGMDDTPGRCECETCRAPITAADGRMLTPKDGEEFWCARFYEYINKLDDEIQKVYPGFETSTFAYYYAKRCPAIRLNKTIVPVFCCYGRKDRANPVFAPVNAQWLELYKSWMPHSAEIGMYDYYGFLDGRPYAEVYQRELQAQREIGFLRTSTEGFMRNDFLGGADERWVMTRLMWNPDQDVERLHRYFNRRAYREAAPAMDRFRGAIRKAVFAADAADAKDPDFRGKNKELKAIILAAGIVEELHGYLTDAENAATHSVSRELVRRTKDALDLLTGKAKPPPKDPLAKKAKRKKRPPLPDFEKTLRENVLAKEILPAIEKGVLATAEAAFAEFAQKAETDDNRTSGVYGYWATRKEAPSAIRRMADRFSAQEKYRANHRPEEGARLYDIWMNIDGDLLPVDFRLQRLEAKIAFLKANKMPLAAAETERRELLKRVAVEGATAGERGRALLALEGAAAIDRVLFDRFMPNNLRRDAALRIVEAHTADGKADWKAAADHLFRAIADSDWSNLARNCYSRQNSDDYRLDAVVGFCEKAMKAGEGKLALDLFNRAEKELGYDRDVRQALKDENRTISGAFERETAVELGARYGKIRKLRDKLTGFATKVQDENGIDEITLDE